MTVRTYKTGVRKSAEATLCHDACASVTVGISITTCCTPLGRAGQTYIHEVNLGNGKSYGDETRGNVLGSSRILPRTFEYPT